ncbi:hypothetical protein [Curtobacterium flaccumfaciens]
MLDLVQDAAERLTIDNEGITSGNRRPALGAVRNGAMCDASEVIDE